MAFLPLRPSRYKPHHNTSQNKHTFFCSLNWQPLVFKFSFLQDSIVFEDRFTTSTVLFPQHVCMYVVFCSRVRGDTHIYVIIYCIYSTFIVVHIYILNLLRRWHVFVLYVALPTHCWCILLCVHCSMSSSCWKHLQLHFNSNMRAPFYSSSPTSFPTYLLCNYYDTIHTINTIIALF